LTSGALVAELPPEAYSEVANAFKTNPAGSGGQLCRRLVVVEAVRRYLAAADRAGVDGNAVGLDDRFPLRGMAVGDVRAMIGLRRQERLPDPDHVGPGLPVQRHAGQDAGMHEQIGPDPMADRQVAKKDQMRPRDAGGPFRRGHGARYPPAHE